MRDTASRYLWLSVGILAVLFLLLNSGGDLSYIIPRRTARLAAIAIGSICVAFSSITFQTITENRILTPAIMGYEAVYLLLQASLILTLGVGGATSLGVRGNFLLSIAVLLGYSLCIHRWLARDSRHNIYVILLTGFVVTVALQYLTDFIQFAIDPGEFALLYSYSHVSFTRPKPEQLAIAAFLVAGSGWFLWRSLATLDVFSLGQNHATSLGIDTAAFIRKQLALVAILVAVSTSLLGPTAYIGVFVANITYQLVRHHRHKHLLPIAAGVAMIVFLVAQILVEHAFNYKTTVSILVNMLCGAYFMVFLMRRQEAL